jgi:hypothetical protein
MLRAVAERVGGLPRANAVSTPSCAMRPSATMARSLGSDSIRERRNALQVLISAGSGLFCGGTQRTALEIIASLKPQPVMRVRAVDAFRKAEAFSVS